MMGRVVSVLLLLHAACLTCTALKGVSHAPTAPLQKDAVQSAVCRRFMPHHHMRQGCRSVLLVNAAGCAQLRLRGGGDVGGGEPVCGASADPQDLVLDAEGDGSETPLEESSENTMILEKAKRLVELHLALKKKEKERLALMKRQEQHGEDAGALGCGNTADLQADRMAVEFDMDICVSHFKTRLMQLLAWRESGKEVGGDTGGAAWGCGTEDAPGKGQQGGEALKFQDWNPGDVGARAGVLQAKGRDRKGALDDGEAGEGRGLREAGAAGSGEDHKGGGGGDEGAGGGGGRAGGQREAPAHSRGGFACVLLDKEYKVAFRLEPMRNQVENPEPKALHRNPRSLHPATRSLQPYTSSPEA
jgi:hypothetical protein